MMSILGSLNLEMKQNIYYVVLLGENSGQTHICSKCRIICDVVPLYWLFNCCPFTADKGTLLKLVQRRPNCYTITAGGKFIASSQWFPEKLIKYDGSIEVSTAQAQHDM